MDSDLIRRLHDVLDAAASLLEARERDLLTNEEWDGLARALLAADEDSDAETVLTVCDGAVVRSRELASGAVDEIACARRSFAAVANAVADMDSPDADSDGEAPRRFTVDEVARAADVTWAEALVAVEFLERLGLVARDADARNRLVAAADFDAGRAVDAFDAAGKGA